MKTILLVTFALMHTVFASSQTVISTPKTGMSTTENIKITKIELTDSSTVLYFHTTYTPNSWIFIPNETFICPVGSDKKLFIKATKGIPKNEEYWMPASGMVDYQLIFPKIDNDVISIDYGEANGGGWNIFDIQLREVPHVSIIPDELLGNWFNKKGGLWELSFLDSLAVYKSEVWRYCEFVYKNGKGFLVLENDDKKEKISLKMEGTNLLIDEPSNKTLNLIRTRPKSMMNSEEKPYSLPVFRRDTATLCGLINGYSSRSGINSISINSSNILSGEHTEIKAAINPNGVFKVKIPLFSPQNIYIRAGIYNGSIFLEPGKETFIMIESGADPLYMGDCAELNTDLDQLRPNISFNKKGFDEKMLDMTPDKYKLYCNRVLQNDLDSLRGIVSKNGISVKVFQIICLEEEYICATKLLNYKSNYTNAYRNKNNIPRTQRSLPVSPESPGDEYYGFITNELVNNQLAAMTSGYNSFINSLKYSEILRKGAASMPPTVREIEQMLNESDYAYTDDERRMIEAIKSTETSESEEFQEKYAEQIMALYMNHLDVLRNILQEKKGNVLMSDIEKLLTEKGVKLADSEKELMRICIARENSGSEIKNRQVKEKFRKEYEQFMTKNRTAIGAHYMREQKQARNEMLSKKFGIQPGLCLDVLNAQDVCRGIVSELTPITDEEMQKFRQQISIPFIADYVEICNNETKTKNEVAKRLKIAVVNEVPDVEADKLFDAIIERYKGKVVYLDFWATWCGPCRAGIEKIKPLKELMVNENVVFVYITGETSPKTTYDNMIPAIRGEHYRLSSEEWNFVGKKFNITGIPHYVLVGKDGKVINSHLGHMSNADLKALLTKHIEE